MNVIQVTGCERSGTNYIQWMLLNNFTEILIICGKWKHMEPTKKDSIFLNELSKNDEIIKAGHPPIMVSNFQSEDYVNIVKNNIIKFILVVKNPYAQYLSYSSFWPGIKLSIIIEKWNFIYKNWLNYIDKNKSNCYLIKYEDVLSNKKNFITNIGNYFSLNQNEEKDCDKYMGTNCKPFEKSYLDGIIKTDESNLDNSFAKKRHNLFTRNKNKFDPNFYLNKEYVNFLSIEEINSISRIVNKKLMSRFNYDIL